MESAASPRPRKLYGEVRGLNAPPRSIVAPAALTASAVSSVCPRDSTVHGPAISANASPPTRRPRTWMTVGSGVVARETSLYGLETGSTRSTPPSASSESAPSRELSPTAPPARLPRGGVAGAAPPRGHAPRGADRGQPDEHVLDVVVGRLAAHHDHE